MRFKTMLLGLAGCLAVPGASAGNQAGAAIFHRLLQLNVIEHQHLIESTLRRWALPK